MTFQLHQGKRLVAREGVAPPTRGFSVLCSTPELPRHLFIIQVDRRQYQESITYCNIFVIRTLKWTCNTESRAFHGKTLQAEAEAEAEARY